MGVPEIELNDGVRIPQLGFGVWQVDDAGAEAAVAVAIETGYRSIDTAKLYQNEAGVGRAVRASAVPREELFLTTKLWNDDQGADRALAAFDRSLERLGTEYVDLFLIHWPAPRQDLYVETWRALQQVAKDGRVRSLGVSNFGVEQLDRLAAETGLAPSVNQIELHPYLSQAELRDYHRDHRIATEAWSPLGQGKGLLDDPVLAEIGAVHGRTAAQVVLRWHLQLGNVVIPKSVTPSRIRENFAVLDFELSADDLTAIAALNRDERYGPDPATFG